jgi:hypothetical protein
VDAADQSSDLADELLAVGVRGVVVGRQFRGDLVCSPGRDEQDGALHGGQAAEDEVEQDERIGVEAAAAVAHHPAGQEDQRREYEGPRAHPVAQPVGSALAERQLVASSQARVTPREGAVSAAVS